MKLITYRYSGTEAVGILEGETVHPLPVDSMLALIESGSIPAPDGTPLALADVELLSPIPRPGRM